jgi:uncharacterized DUF497 family protein
VAKFIYYQWLADFLETNEFEFLWDEGNSQKNFDKHGVSCSEAEEVFSDERLIALGLQVSPESSEERFGIMGETINKRLLLISFTIRHGRIRVISVRTANKKERGIYEK